MLRRSLVAVTVLGAAALFPGGATPTTPAKTLPSAAQLKGLSAVQALKVANTWRSAGGVQSFVTDRAVTFRFPDGAQVDVPLPRDRMVVAVAPYVTRTHPCKTHYMSGCQGELVNVPVNVVVTGPDGKVVLRRTMTTLANGFLEVWLPRGKTYSLSLQAQGRAVKGQISTLPGSDTCVTTLQLR